jgi:hypothetical protein
MSELKKDAKVSMTLPNKGADAHETLMLILQELRVISARLHDGIFAEDFSCAVGETAAQTGLRIGIPEAQRALSQASSELRR